MYNILIAVTSVIVFSDAASALEAYHTNCSGMGECFRLQAEIEKLELDYLAAVDDRSKYNKICPRRKESYACFEKLKPNCHLSEVSSAINIAYDNHDMLCEQYKKLWDDKNASTLLKNVDLNCREVAKCVKKLNETDKIGVNLFMLWSDEKYYKNLCSSAEKMKSCLAKKKFRCEMTNIRAWIDMQSKLLQIYCSSDGPELFAEYWSVIKKGCPRDKCYNDIRNIDTVKLEKVKSIKDFTKKKEFCKIRDTFTKCEQSYEHFCEVDRPVQVLNTKDHLEGLVCSKNEEDDIAMTVVCNELNSCLLGNENYIDTVLNFDFRPLINKIEYDELCKMNDTIYDCYLTKRQRHNCTKDIYHLQYEKRRLLRPFVCSVEGKKAIALLQQSKCTRDMTTEVMTYEDYECRFAANRRQGQCPFLKKMAECLADILEKQEGCGKDFSSFFKEIYSIVKSKSGCYKERQRKM